MKMHLTKLAAAAGVAICVASGFTQSAFANGDEFFGIEEMGPVDFLYFGSVKDESGQFLSGAEVTLKVSDPELIFVEQTDVIGRFRTMDVGRQLLERGYDVDPSTFSLSVALQGYKQVRKLDRRPGRLNKGSFEVNFVMSKDAGAKAK